MQQEPRAYRGRFAPSPTGPLHIGSLVAAVGSFLDARANNGEWLVRIEDLDSPRQEPGADSLILKTLEDCGLYWDGQVMYQRTRRSDYHAAASLLMERNQAYPCTCSRREIADSGILGLEGPRYPGICRPGVRNNTRKPAIRLRVPEGCSIVFTDRLQGRISQHLDAQVGDFIIYRADGHAAYQLAVVLDDAYQGITHVVRGADLLISTPRQLYLQQLLGLLQPIYMHLPVALDAHGEKISKQTGASPVDTKAPGRELYRALRFLGQLPPPQLHAAPPAELLAWAVSHWQPENIGTFASQKII
ncbi:MAG: tRNA glutamyl-Q(34) synthetase GluQRS [Gammaproteobacteria bacterium]|nr:tRNA glutamyl-Q(34) synthetase GluQRS [Gammaproteobacteria bacterium]MDE2345036.1 tRNA glutamyl-Q(34) synthetase GluQRS [Gammaproteobacteria bacterium]